jgi:undecaprenyl-diphosphatase
MPDQRVDLLTSIVLGAVQGVTEFLPISSDGHIALFALLFGETEMPLSMVVLLHVGTLIATFLVFRADVAELLRSIGRGMRAPREWLATPDGQTIAAIVVASIPTAMIGLFLRDHVEHWAHVPWIVGACLLGTAAAVLSTRFTAARSFAATSTAASSIPGSASGPSALPLRHAIIVGIAQGLAVLPGLSRSGSTIACMMLLGTAAPAAFRLSFLMSLPAVLGAVLLELRHPGEVIGTLGASALIGALVSFFVGWGSLLALRALVARGHFWTFALYLVPLGLTLIAWDLSR